MTKPKMKIKKGDTVKVIQGKHSGKKGKVLEAIPQDNRVIIEGINKVKRHMRPTKGAPQGGIVEKEAPINVSNVMVVCKKCGKPTRVGKKILDDGSRKRYCKKCDQLLD